MARGNELGYRLRRRRESIASRGSERSSTWSRHPTSRRLDSTGAPGWSANAGCPPPRAARSGDEGRVDLHRDAHPSGVASGASTLLQPLGPSRLAIYRGTRRPTLPHHYLDLRSDQSGGRPVGQLFGLSRPRRFT